MALSSELFTNAVGTRGARDFAWDKTVFERLEKYRSKSLRTVLLQIMPHANLAFALGLAEWTCRQLDSVTDCRPTLDYIEGLWAAMIDRRYLIKKKMEFQKFTWHDNARDAVLFVNDQLFQVYSHCKGNNPDRATDTAQLTALARHVSSDSQVLDRWIEDVLKRLTTFFGAQGGELGPGVPREVLDTMREYQPGRRVEYLNAFLMSLNPAENPFLAAPASLTDPDFAGTPYKAAE